MIITIIKPVRIDLDMDKRKVAGGKRIKERTDKRTIERVTVEAEDPERAGGRGGGEEGDERRACGGGEAKDGECELAQVRCAQAREKRREEGVP